MLLCVVVTFASCKKTSTPDPDPDPNPNPNPIGKIFVAGVDTSGVYPNVSYVAKYWVDGKAFPLTDGGNGYATATSIYVADGHVYVAGSEKSNKVDVAKYWKDGQAVVLGDGIKRSFAYSIVVLGSDVYVAGESDGKAVYWKNNTMNVLPDGVQANSIAVVGTDIYIAGNNRISINYESTYTVKYWKNGVSADLETSNSVNNVSSIFVKGEDVYVTGFIHNTDDELTARYWKNGTATDLSGSTSSSIFVDGQDIYVSGTKENPDPSSSPYLTYWKNGTPTIINTTGFAEEEGIFVSNGDVYVVGREGTVQSKNITAKYWKNGVATTVEGLDQGNAIFIVK